MDVIETRLAACELELTSIQSRHDAAMLKYNCTGAQSALDFAELMRKKNEELHMLMCKFNKMHYWR